MNWLVMVKGAIKAQWAFSLVLLVTAFTTWLLIANAHHGLEAAAYKFAVVIVGGLSTKSVLAASVRAYPTMLLMIVSAMFLTGVALVATHAEVFKDSAVEGMLLMLAGAIVMLMGELLARFQPNEDR